MNIDQIQSILGAEIECGVFESVVVPALDVCRKVAHSSAATVSDADRALNSLVISTARETGLRVRIDGKMLNDNYTNVTGSFPALVRFARALLAAASAQATAPVGWFVQRSSFGPWIEVERYEDGAVRLHRMDGAQATAQAAPNLVTLYETLMMQAIETSSESYLTLRCVGVPPTEAEFVSAVQRIVYAAPYPAAREAGDGVSEVQPPAGLTEREQFIWNLGHSAAAGSLQDAERYRWLREHHFSTLTNEEIDQQIAADAALLREAGSR